MNITHDTTQQNEVGWENHFNDIIGGRMNFAHFKWHLRAKKKNYTP